MNTRAVPPDFVSNHTPHRHDVPLLVDAESGELRCKVSGISLDGGVTVDNSGVEGRLGALTESAPASDSASSGLNGLLRRLLGKIPTLVSGRLPVDGSGVTQPISGTITANLGTLNGSATAAKQDTAQTTLSAIDSKLGAALPLPTGAATSAGQTTANNSLAAIDGKLPSLASGRVPVDPSGVTQPISVAALPLPTGAATSAAQTTAQTTLAAIDTKLGAALPLPTGAATAAAQTTANGSLASIEGKVGIAPSADTAAHGINRTRSTTLGNAAVAVKAGAGNLLGLTVMNPNDVPVYLKFYDTAQGSVTVGTTAIVDTIPVPPAAEGEPGIVMIAPGAFPCLPRFGTAITVAAVTGLADNSSADPSTDLVAQFYHA